MAWVRLAARTAALVGVLLAVLAVRVVTASRAELHRGEQLLARGDEDGAILAFRRSARLYAPGSPYGAESLERLFRIARDAEGRADLPQALAAYRAVRGAILASRSFYVPYGDLLQLADQRIARLSFEVANARAGSRTPAVWLSELRAPARPKLGWTVLLLAGWVLWVASAFVLVRRGIDEDDHVLGEPTRRWLTFMLVGFGSFVLGMALA
jgi:hypothetical protein